MARHPTMDSASYLLPALLSLCALLLLAGGCKTEDRAPQTATAGGEATPQDLAQADMGAEEERGDTAVVVEAPASATLEQLLGAEEIYVFAADEVILSDPRRDPGRCEAQAQGCSATWLDRSGGAPGATITRRKLTVKEAREYLEILSQPDSYGVAPAACYDPRLAVAFYRDDEPMPWATVSTCISCANVGVWPRVAAVLDAPPPVEEGGMGTEGISPKGLGRLRQWCEGLGLTSCTKHRAYYEEQDR